MLTEILKKCQERFSGKNKPELLISCSHTSHTHYRNIGTPCFAVLMPEGEPAHLLGFMFGLLPEGKTSFGQSQHRAVLLSGYIKLGFLPVKQQ